MARITLALLVVQVLPSQCRTNTSFTKTIIDSREKKTCEGCFGLHLKAFDFSSTKLGSTFQKTVGFLFCCYWSWHPMRRN